MLIRTRSTNLKNEQVPDDNQLVTFVQRFVKKFKNPHEIDAKLNLPIMTATHAKWRDSLIIGGWGGRRFWNGTLNEPMARPIDVKVFLSCLESLKNSIAKKMDRCSIKYIS